MSTEPDSSQPEAASFGLQVVWFPVIALTALGLLFVFSSSSVYAGQKFNDEYLFFKKQLMFVAPALLLGLLGSRIKLSFIDKYSGKFFLLAVLATFLTKAPFIGKKVLGASRWLSLGGFQIQPSEFLKIACVLFATHLLATDKNSFRHLWPIPLAVLALLLQPDFGSTIILLCGLVAIIFIHGVPLRFFLLGLGLALPVLVVVMISAPYRLRRLVTFLDPFADPLGAGFQVIQSFVAVANGGWLGKGLGGSQQKLFFLPEAHTDFILAVITEEMGFAGLLVIVSIYLLFFAGILQMMRRIRHHRDRLLATGIFAMLASSTMVNMGVVSGLLPTKGLPLPFISAGGSSLLANFLMVGILSQIFKNAGTNPELVQTPNPTIAMQGEAIV